VAAASCLLFDGDGRLVVANIRSRGWDVPGGRLGNGEGVLDGLGRELAEEVGAHAGEYTDPELLGWLLIESPVPELLLYYRATLSTKRVLTTEVPGEVGAVARLSISDLPEEVCARAWFPLLERSLAFEPAVLTGETPLYAGALAAFAKGKLHSAPARRVRRDLLSDVMELESVHTGQGSGDLGVRDGRGSAANRAEGCVEAILAGNEDTAFRWCIQLSDDLKAVGPGRLAELVAEAPELTGEIRYDALIAAIVENACEAAGVVAPSWVGEPARTMEPGSVWYTGNFRFLHEEALATALPAFKAHGAFVLPSEFESVCGRSQRRGHCGARGTCRTGR
jgi:8-oxo-dGTP pyrophosphatase MutT (NUDIX family)